MSDMVNVHAKYWKMIGDLNQDKAELLERIKRLEDWKQSQLEVEREWDANAIATVLGGKLGESHRKVIQREVPLLLDRIKRLEEAGDGLMKSINCGCPYGPSVFNCQTCTNSWDAWRKAKEDRL